MKIYIGIGATEKQKVAFEVLKYSILKHIKNTGVDVEIFSLNEIEMEISLAGRTPFSFQRFAFSSWCFDRFKKDDIGIYLDSDMLVFSSIEDLVSEFLDLKQNIATCNTSPSWKRVKQSSVIVFNSIGAKEISNKYCHYLKGELNYVELFNFPKEQINFLPYQWNSIESFDVDTCLMHYSDMDTQPWLKAGNINSGIWIKYLNELVSRDKIKDKEFREDVKKGFIRPSILSLIGGETNFPIESYFGILKDILFVPPHRVRRIPDLKLLKPLRILVYRLSMIRSNNRINKVEH